MVQESSHIRVAGGRFEQVRALWAASEEKSRIKDYRLKLRVRRIRQQFDTATSNAASAEKAALVARF